MWIQVILLLAVAVLLLGFVRWQNGVRLQASKRLAFFAFVAANVWFVLRPDDLTAIANLLNVGRGADLLLYMLVVAFVFAVLNMYLRFRDLGERFTELARAIALRDAEILNRERGLLPEPVSQGAAGISHPPLGTAPGEPTPSPGPPHDDGPSKADGG